MRSQYPCDTNSYRDRAKIQLGTFSFLDMQSYTEPEAPADCSSLLWESSKASPLFPGARWHTSSPPIVVILLTIIIVRLATGGSISIVPTTRVVGNILCHYITTIAKRRRTTLTSVYPRLTLTKTSLRNFRFSSCHTGNCSYVLSLRI